MSRNKMAGLVANARVCFYHSGTIKIDPNKTLLSDHLKAFENHLGHLVHLPGEEGVAVLVCRHDGSKWLCWEGNGSIYLEDKP